MSWADKFNKKASIEFKLVINKSVMVKYISKLAPNKWGYKLVCRLFEVNCIVDNLQVDTKVYNLVNLMVDKLKVYRMVNIQKLVGNQ